MQGREAYTLQSEFQQLYHQLMHDELCSLHEHQINSKEESAQETAPNWTWEELVFVDIAPPKQHWT